MILLSFVSSAFTSILILKLLFLQDEERIYGVVSFLLPLKKHRGKISHLMQYVFVRRRDSCDVGNYTPYLNHRVPSCS